MGQVQPDGFADDAHLRLPPADAGHEAVLLQPQEGAQGAADVVALRFGRPHLGPLDAAVLLQAAVVALDAPGPLGVLQAGEPAHRQVAVAQYSLSSFGGDPEDQHEAVARQADAGARLGDGAVRERAVAGASIAREWSFLLRPSVALS